ncbi:MAG TPA: hypothetical protein VJP80_04625 [Candidatus Saccharimonadales bacterium]|nr:hypothetical protein [Candidatus Saccharimonadales bacterium]
MNVHCSEAVERRKAFDRFVEITNDALQHPEVVSRLGGMAAELSAVAQQFFLPNVYHGQASVPFSLRGQADKVALLPLNAQEVDRAFEVVDPLLGVWADRMPVPETLYSEAYGREVDPRVELAALRPSSSDDDGGDLSEYNAATITGTDMNGGFMFKRSAPVIVISNNFAQPGQELAAASTTVHETTHAWYVFRNCPLIDTPPSIASSELYAYENDGVVLESLGDPDDLADTVFRTVRELQQQHGLPKAPHTATPDLIRAFEAYGIM